VIDKILKRPELVEKPPVLIDIGASGKIHRAWRKFAKHAICLAFDADERDFNYVVDESGKYRKLYVYNCIVADQAVNHTNFYLTKSPHCSSLLEPDLAGLKDTAWAERFAVEKIKEIKTVGLPQVLQELGLSYVDWFKTDSQGIDLRLFRSLDEEIRQKVLVAEFEPGLINAYKGEDKLHTILAFMEASGNFWLSKLVVKGSRKISSQALQSVFKSAFWQKLTMFSLKNMAGWGELTYLNELKPEQPFTLRDYLLAWVFATEQGEHGFALMLAQRADKQFDDPILGEMIAASQAKLKWGIWQLKFMPVVWARLRQMLGWE
jgi:hypothetical protein